MRGGSIHFSYFLLPHSCCSDVTLLASKSSSVEFDHRSPYSLPNKPIAIFYQFGKCQTAQFSFFWFCPESLVCELVESVTFGPSH